MTDKKIRHVIILITLAFLSLMVYLTYFEMFEKPKIEKSAYNQFNPRIAAEEYDIKRGSIYDKNQTVLAYSENDKRIYPYGKMYSNLIGYSSKTYGKSMLELSFNDRLLGKDDVTNALSLVKKNNSGFNLTLTIDHAVQQVAYNSMGNANGAVVAINPQTGEVIALVSKPDFNPDDAWLTENWDILTEDESSPLMARATTGLYAPGSTFKILTSVCAYENNLEDMTFEDNGSIEIDGHTFNNAKGHAYGSLDFTGAFKNSSNVAFCRIGSVLGSEKMRETAESFCFNTEIDFDIPLATSYFEKGKTGKVASAALGIGQGSTLVTPFQMALVGCGIANDGVIMQPYIVKRVTTQNGALISDRKSTVLANATSASASAFVKDMMVETVRTGTGTTAQIYGVNVAAKTGTAENEKTDSKTGGEHTWFLAFAPAEDPQIVVAVMQEYSGGYGSSNCGPIAKNVMSTYLSR